MSRESKLLDPPRSRDGFIQIPVLLRLALAPESAPSNWASSFLRISKSAT
jgi:hypothetical protein